MQKSLFIVFIVLFMNSFQGVRCTGTPVDLRVLFAYLAECKAKSQNDKYYADKFAKEGTCGFVSMHDIHMKTKKDGDQVIIETTVWGNRDELEKPLAAMVNGAEETLKAQILQQVTENKRQGSIATRIGFKTKCQAPVYYGENRQRGWILCETFTSMFELWHTMAYARGEFGNGTDSNGEWPSIS